MRSVVRRTVPKKPPAREKRLRRRKAARLPQGHAAEIRTEADVIDLAVDARSGRAIQGAADHGHIFAHDRVRPEAQRAADHGDAARNFAVDIGRTADGDHVAGDDFVARHGDVAADANDVAASACVRGGASGIRLIAILLPVRLGGGGVHASQVALRGRVQVSGSENEVGVLAEALAGLTRGERVPVDGHGSVANLNDFDIGVTLNGDQSQFVLQCDDVVMRAEFLAQTGDIGRRLAVQEHGHAEREQPRASDECIFSS